jgi:hypothetical protein
VRQQQESQKIYCNRFTSRNFAKQRIRLIERSRKGTYIKADNVHKAKGVKPIPFRIKGVN